MEVNSDDTLSDSGIPAAAAKMSSFHQTLMWCSAILLHGYKIENVSGHQKSAQEMIIIIDGFSFTCIYSHFVLNLTVIHRGV